MVREQYERAKRLLSEHSDGHRALADLLLEREVIFAEDVERIFGKRPWTSRSEEIFDKNEENDINVNINTDEPSQGVESADGASE
jgi:cell division protease FtsH